MNQEPKDNEKPKTNSKVEVRDLEPKKDPKGGVTPGPILITKPIDKNHP